MQRKKGKKKDKKNNLGIKKGKSGKNMLLIRRKYSENQI